MHWKNFKSASAVLLPLVLPALSPAQTPPDPKAHITLQPADVTVPIGGIARFGIAAGGQEPITYLWLRNGIPLPSSDGPEWVLSVPSNADHGAQFRCVVANDFGVDTSAVATLHVSATLQAPRILVQPDSSPVALGDTAWLKVKVGGTPPLSFAWFRNDVALGQETDSILKLSPVAWSDNGAAYRCRITNAAGTVDTRIVRLQVIQPNGKTVVLSGDIRDLQGAPVGEAGQSEMDMVVRLYRDAKGGAPLYEERFLTSENHGVKVSGGRFTLALGRSVANGDLSLVAQANSALYVSFAVAKPGLTPETLEPRTPFTAAPYSLATPKSSVQGAP